jgi:hypothetical protein
MKFTFPFMMLVATCFGQQQQLDYRMQFMTTLITADVHWRENRKEQALKLYDELISQTQDGLVLKGIQLRKGLLEHEMGLVEASAEDIFIAVTIPGITDDFIVADADIKASVVDIVLQHATEFKEAFLSRVE